MSAQHTPGPWFIWKERAMREEGLDPDEIEFELAEQDCFEVMSGEPVGPVSRGRIRGCKTVVDLDADDFGDDPDEGRAIALANARLIAAAPDLLAALQGVAAMSRCGQLDEFIGEPWLNAVHAAIALADSLEGGE